MSKRKKLKNLLEKAEKIDKKIDKLRAAGVDLSKTKKKSDAEGGKKNKTATPLAKRKSSKRATPDARGDSASD